MTSRDRIFEKIHEATNLLPEKTPMPDADSIQAIRSQLMPPSNDTATLVAHFREKWIEVGGLVVESEDELVALLKSLGASMGYVAPGLPAAVLSESFKIETSFDRPRVDEYSFGITKATCGLAETGTVALTDRDTPNRLSALAPWIHVAVLNKESIFPSLSEALSNIEDDPSIVFITGPSKTADIEGVLIKGVHGPGIQVCWLV